MNIHKNARLTPLRREEMALSVLVQRFQEIDRMRIHLNELWR